MCGYYFGTDLDSLFVINYSFNSFKQGLPQRRCVDLGEPTENQYICFMTGKTKYLFILLQCKKKTLECFYCT